MKFVDFKINEEGYDKKRDADAVTGKPRKTSIGSGKKPKGYNKDKAEKAAVDNVKKVLGMKEARIASSNINSIDGYMDAINELLKKPNYVFKVSNVVDKKEVLTDFVATPGQQIYDQYDAITGKGQIYTKKRGEEAKLTPTDQVTVGALYKSTDIKKLAGKATDGIVFNTGEVAEGIHAVAAFVRLIKRPSEPITLNDLPPIIKRLKNGKTLTLTANEVESDIADQFNLTVSLKTQQFDALKELEKITQAAKLKNVARDIIDDANEESGRFADLYQKNGKFDKVSVIGDGVSGETERKTDIDFENETERKYRGYSIKAGSTSQLHQVGGGATRLPSAERFDIIEKELFGVHGRAQLIDMSGKDEDGNVIKDKFVEYMDSGMGYRAYRYAYQQAVALLNAKLQTDQQEEDFVKNLIIALKYWMRRDDEGVLLKQFSGTGKGTYILDAEKLDELEGKGLNLVAKMAPTQDPTLRIVDTHSKKALIEFRAKGEEKASGSYYFRNIINKGPLFVTLTNIKKSKES